MNRQIMLKQNRTTKIFKNGDCIDVRQYSGDDNLVVYDNLGEFYERLIEEDGGDLSQDDTFKKIFNNTNRLESEITDLKDALTATNEELLNIRTDRTIASDGNIDFDCEFDIKLVKDVKILVEDKNYKEYKINKLEKELEKNYSKLPVIAGIELECNQVFKEIKNINGDSFIAYNATNVNVYPTTLEGYIECIKEYMDTGGSSPWNTEIFYSDYMYENLEIGTRINNNHIFKKCRELELNVYDNELKQAVIEWFNAIDNGNDMFKESFNLFKKAHEVLDGEYDTDEIADEIFVGWYVSFKDELRVENPFDYLDELLEFITPEDESE